MQTFELSEIYGHVPEVVEHIEWLRKMAEWNRRQYEYCIKCCLKELTEPDPSVCYFTQEYVMDEYYKNYEQMNEEADYLESRLRDLSFRK